MREMCSRTLRWEDLLGCDSAGVSMFAVVVVEFLY